MSKQIQSPIEGSVLEGISKVLGDTANGLTGIEIGKFLQKVSISDCSGSEIIGIFQFHSRGKKFHKSNFHLTSYHVCFKLNPK
jgi:hypothetical protein